MRSLCILLLICWTQVRVAQHQVVQTHEGIVRGIERV